ncbi:MAG: ABC transporter ATP-binding protein [Pyrinomonadaceae bacterium]|nr:ABC transporter ATP-binding protein [Pyrinomonadaceae bacterium]
MAEKPQKKRRISFSKAWGDARELVWAHRRRLALGGLLMIISRLAGLVLPASSKYLIDDVIGKQRLEMLKWIALAIGLATVVQAVTSFALSQILGVAAQYAITQMRKRVQAKVERLPVSYFDSTQSGQLISRIMTDAEGIRNLVGTGLVQLVGSSITAIISIAVLFWINWRMTSVTIVVLALFGGVLYLAFTRLRPIFRERQEINAQVTGRLGESLGGIRVVKSYTAEKREELVFARGAHRLFRNIAKSMTGVSAMTGFSSVIIGAIGVVVILVGGNSVIARTMTLGDLFMYIFFTGLMAMPIIEFTAIGTQITEAFAGLDRIREVLSSVTEDEEDSSKLPLPNVKGAIAFEDVHFEYEENTPVLEGISFDSAAGTTTALVGSSGSGKSTILNLVLNFIQPKKGRVLVDGKDIQTIKLRDYRRHLGVVLQENFLFDGTIIDNVRFSNTHATFDQVKEACRIAYCDDFIEKFENGYETIVGERGVKLSGGQRQRIAIARALLANPKILILDEATSSLDSESEKKIQDGLKSLRMGRTTFVIAHRLSTIRSANKILVVEEGKIVESGTHDDLLRMNGRYKQLYDKQYQFEKNQFINPGEDFTPDLAEAKITNNRV